MIKKSFKVLFCCLLLQVLAAGYAYGYSGLVPCGREGFPECRLCHLWELGSNIVDFIMWTIAMPLGAILFVVAGVFFLLAGSNEQFLTRAKTIFRNTVIGLALVFCSWLIINTIFNVLTGGKVLTEPWNVEVECYSPHVE